LIAGILAARLWHVQAGQATRAALAQSPAEGEARLPQGLIGS
jgi:hypothetical protein